tara:strand:+ start:2875 stop:3354 length:480 start_codon:yes stop_codon:yes gene_type:complete
MDEIEYVKAKKKVKKIQKEWHNNYKKENKRTLRTLDIMVILILILHTGVIFMTNALVIKEIPPEDLVFIEAVPETAELYGYEAIKDEEGEYDRSFINGLKTEAVSWAILMAFYLMFRFTIRTEEGLGLLFFVVLLMASIVYLDFIHDAGFYFGRIWWGG